MVEQASDFACAGELDVSLELGISPLGYFLAQDGPGIRVNGEDDEDLERVRASEWSLVGVPWSKIPVSGCNTAFPIDPPPLNRHYWSFGADGMASALMEWHQHRLVWHQLCYIENSALSYQYFMCEIAPVIFVHGFITHVVMCDGTEDRAKSRRPGNLN